MAQIDAPRHPLIWITYFNQLADLEVPQLCQFIERSGDLNQPMHCSVLFQDNLVSFDAYPTTHDLDSELLSDIPGDIEIVILCEGIDWQVSHLARVLNQISAVLSNTIHSAIFSNSTSPEPEDMDDIGWLELVRPFSSVQTLFVSKEFAGHVSRSLENTAAVMATEVLPALEMLCLEDQPVPSVHKFIAARWESGLPVTTVDTREEFEDSLVSYIN
jgi:hypothetical protein